MQLKLFGEACCDFWSDGGFIPDEGLGIGVIIRALHGMQFRPFGVACCDFWPDCS